MRKSFSTQRLEKVIRLLPLLTDSDILYLQKAIHENINLRRVLNDRVLLGHEKGTPNATRNPILAAQPDQST